MRNLLVVMTLLAYSGLSVSADFELTDRKVQKLANYLDSVLKTHDVTCENYETKCATTNIKPEENCKIWAKNSLCDKTTSKEGLRNTLSQIADSIEAAASVKKTLESRKTIRYA